MAVRAPFVRPLYPPSSPNKSEAGVDVVAVKRSLSRCGLWPWQAFDQDYNEKFSGAVAKFNAAHGRKASKVYTSETHKDLCAAKAVKPHAGEPAIDSVSLELFNQAKAALDPPELKIARQLYAYCGEWDGAYLWGGGHDGTPLNDSPHIDADCSGSTSDVLAKYGLLGSSTQHVAEWFESWGEPGRGLYFTVHAANDHVWIEFTIPGLPWARFDTSPHNCGEHGPRMRTCARDTARFVSRHAAGY